MAEAIFRQMAMGANCPWRIGSAGTYAANGAWATQEAREVMQDLGLNIDGHRSRQLSEDILADVDLVLTMTENQKNMIKGEFPHLAHRVFTVKEFSGQGEDPNIGDPFGYGVDTYRQVAKELQEYLALVFDELQAKNCRGLSSQQKG